jgi:hypothetical protein
MIGLTILHLGSPSVNKAEKNAMMPKNKLLYSILLPLFCLIQLTAGQFPSAPIRFIGEGRIIARNVSAANTNSCFSGAECGPPLGCISDNFHWTLDTKRCGSFFGIATGELFNGWEGQWMHNLSSAHGPCGLGKGKQVVCGQDAAISQDESFKPYWFEVRFAILSCHSVCCTA